MFIFWCLWYTCLFIFSYIPQFSPVKYFLIELETEVPRT